ncbi:MAG TPA: ABC transporter ATP-binding protein [Patescibacteria group bacterium]|nr:ABC transporter ATP-binding protein [Patescibacteria group bacterium]
MKKIVHDVRSALEIMKRKPEYEKFRFSDLKPLLPYLKPHWRKGVVASILLFFVSLIALPVPYLTKYLVDDVFVSKNFRILHIIVLAMVGLQLAKLIASFLMNYLFTVLNQKILITAKKDLFQRLLRLPISFFDKTQTGYILSRIGEVGGLGLFFSSSIVRLIVGFIEFILCLGILFYLHWKLTILALCILPFYFLATKYFSKGIRVSTLELYEKSAVVSRNIQESLSGINVIKAFATEEREANKINTSLINQFRSNILQSILFSISSEIIMLVSALGGFAILWYSGTEIMRTNFTIGQYVAFAGYLGKLYGPTQQIASMGLTLQPAVTSLRRISELLGLVTEEEDENRVVRVSSLNGEVVFDGVSFCYDGRNEVLHDVSFRIRPSDMAAFVGPSGSGKTTIIRLILGFYKPTKGSILMGGNDINSLVLTNLRERVGIVSQNIFLFNDTVKNNIRYSKIDAADDEVIRASTVAGAHEFIMNLPNGYDTRVGERGTTLSGGQVQRIAIARAILKDPDILIFDEATSHVDDETERAIQKGVEDLFRGKTRIVISHRLSSIKHADKIFVLENGAIARTGTYHQLYSGDRSEFIPPGEIDAV